jgi:protein gp37
MSDRSSIEWTDATWNPMTGCTKISPGCAHCYIEHTPAFRIAGRRFEKGHISLRLHPDRLEQPLHWRRPRHVFVNSLSDLFHADVPDAFIDQVFTTILKTPQHTYQILTKRPERMRAYMQGRGEMFLLARGPLREMDRSDRLVWPPANAWLGVSVENQHFADERIPILLQTPAAVRFLSCEPLLGPVQLAWEGYGLYEYGYLRQGINWVIVGGESGPGARPCDVAWVRAIIAQCGAAGVPCFVKQLGGRPFHERSMTLPIILHTRDRKGADPAEWPADLRVREFPRARGVSVQTF